MGFLEFLVGIASAIAWPVTIFFLVKTFGPQLKEAFSFLEEVQVSGVRAKFRRDLAKVEAAAEKLPDPDPATNEQVLPEDQFAASANAVGVIMETWKEVEFELKDLLRRSNVAVPSAGPTRVIEALRANSLIKPYEYAVLEGLVRTRNRAAHTRITVSRDEVDTYSEAARRLISSIRSR